MSKTRNWPHRALYMLVALALVIGLTVTAAPPTAVEAGTPDSGDFHITGGEYTLDGNEIEGYFTGINHELDDGPYFVQAEYSLMIGTDGPYEGYFGAQLYVEGDRIDFYGEWDGPSVTQPLNPSYGWLHIDEGGWFHLWYETDQGWEFNKWGYIGIPQIEPGFSLDVKGATQKFILVNVPYDNDMHEGLTGLMGQWFEEWAEMDLKSTLQLVQSWNCPVVATDDSWNPYVVVNPRNVPLDTRDGGEAWQGWIKLRMTQPGDCRVEVEVAWPPAPGGKIIVGEDGDVEKKWGVIAHTILDLDPPTDAWGDVVPLIPPKHDNHVSFMQNQSRTLHDWVYAWYFTLGEEEKQVGRAGHAIVHWWLIKDTTTNRAAINQILTDLGRHPTIPDTAVGTWAYEEPPFEDTPKERIDALWTANRAGETWFTDGIDDFYYLAKSGDSTYMKTVTQDSFPGETRGLSEVNVMNVGEEDIIVVTLAEYPFEYHGQNPICIEMGTIEWIEKPPPPDVVDPKVPQVRWAGEKIVLEKDWGEEYAGNWAVYNLEQGELGNLEPIDGESESAQQVWTRVDRHGISRVILASEKQGKADVNVALYYEKGTGFPIANHGFMIFFLAFEDIVLADKDHGAHLDVTTQDTLTLRFPGEDIPVAVQVRGWFTSPHLPGTTREELVSDDGITLLAPAGRYVFPDDWPALANYNYDMRPWWDLMGQAHEGDIWSWDPLGAYNNNVVTTDPPGLAEFPTIGPFNTLQQWSTLDMWIAGANTVPSSWFDFRNTVVPDGELTWHDCPMPQALIIFEIEDWSPAEASPSLSTLWKDELPGYGYSVYADGTATGGAFTRVEDTTKNWTTDALVDRWVVVVKDGVRYWGWITANDATSLTVTDFTAWEICVEPVDLPSAVADGDHYYIPRFQSPFYAVEIPAHPQIPVGPPGYNFDSWGDEQPYAFWCDLRIDSIEGGTTEIPVDPMDVEVYSDNHGIAGVTVDDLGREGRVSITATAEYPYTPKKQYWTISTEIEVRWGADELNPHFVPDRDEVDVDETVTFTNLTAGGTEPYIEAVWEFGDGTVITIEGTHDEVMAPVTHAYTEEGEYYVTLRMTDSTPMTRTEERDDPITVGEPDPNDPNDPNDNDFVDNPPIEEGLASIADELLMVYVWRPATQSWDMYWPAAGIDDIGMLEPGTAYWILVESDCTLEYGTRSWELTEGWNNPAWLPQ